MQDDMSKTSLRPSGRENDDGHRRFISLLSVVLSDLEEEGKTDEDINTIVTPTAPAAIHTGPITRARARQLNYQVLSFLGNDSNVHENMMLPKLDTFVLLTNEGPSLEKDEHWNKNGVTSDDFRTLKPP